MAVDERPIRAEATAACRGYLQKIDAADAALARYKTEDRPAFESWIRGEFGSQLDEMAKLREEAAELSGIAGSVQATIFATGIPAHEAYERVTAALDDDEVPDDDEGPDEDDDDGFDAGGFGGTMSDDEFERFEERLFEEFTRIRGRRGGRGGPDGDPDPSSALKVRYRELVRKLHPDRGEPLSAREQDLWHQARQCYESGDLDGLVMVAALVSVEVSGAFTAVSDLFTAADCLKRRLGKLRREITEARRDVAWAFATLAAQRRKSLKRDVAKELRADARHLKETVAELRDTLDRWKTPPPAARKRGVSSKRAGARTAADRGGAQKGAARKPRGAAAAGTRRAAAP